MLQLAYSNGYVQLYRPDDGCFSFIGHGSVQLDVRILHSHIIVISKLCHPKKQSATKLGRKVESFLLLRKIFLNPRTHTGLGEYLEWAIGEKEQFYHNIRWRNM